MSKVEPNFSLVYDWGYSDRICVPLVKQGNERFQHAYTRWERFKRFLKINVEPRYYYKYHTEVKVLRESELKYFCTSEDLMVGDSFSFDDDDYEISGKSAISAYPDMITGERMVSITYWTEKI